MAQEVIDDGKTLSLEKKTRGVSSLVYVFPSIALILVLILVAVLQVQILSLEKKVFEIQKKHTLGDDSKERRISLRAVKEKNSHPTGIQSVYFQGILPYQIIQLEGKLGPWTSTDKDKENFVKLKDSDKEVEIVQKGIYYVYAQVYYLKSEMYNSFQILLQNGTNRKDYNVLSTCASQSSLDTGGVSCYTGLVINLNSGEKLFLNQVEQNRIIGYCPGCSYFGIVLLQT